MGQDASCVTFRAVDITTDETVSLRRFFPSGPDGTGLDTSQQTRFIEDMDGLTGFRHNAFRTIKSCGCDPVDGMPFIASEWVEGSTLLTCLNSAPLTPEMAIHLLDTALDVSEKISELASHEAVWVASGLSSIIIGTEECGRPLTFSISHFKWVSEDIEKPRGLESLITLTEAVMGWQGVTVNDYTANGLGAWFRWLKNNAQTATLTETRQKLTSCIGAEPPKPMKRSVRPASPSSRKSAKKSRISKARPAIFGCLALGLVGLAGWLLVRHNSASLLKPTSIPEPAPIASTSALDAGLPDEVQLPDPTLEGTPAEPETAQLEEPAHDEKVAETPTPVESVAAPSDSAPEVFAATDYDRLLKQRNQIVTLEGPMESIGHSKSGNTLYLQFSQKPSPLDPRVGIIVKTAPASLTEPELKLLIGKKLRVTGKVRIDPVGKSFRPVLIVQSPSAIKIVE